MTSKQIVKTIFEGWADAMNLEEVKLTGYDADQLAVGFEFHGQAFTVSVTQMLHGLSLHERLTAIAVKEQL